MDVKRYLSLGRIKITIFVEWERCKAASCHISWRHLQTLRQRLVYRNVTGEHTWDQHLQGREGSKMGQEKKSDYSRGLSWSRLELWSWDGPSELSQVEAKGWVFVSLHQFVFRLKLPLGRGQGCLLRQGVFPRKNHCCEPSVANHPGMIASD